MRLDNKINILAISGSLRKNSSKTAILKSMETWTEFNIDFKIYEGIGMLPHFNPEMEEGTIVVNEFRKYLKEADGVIICTPEYAFGVPGVLKNALDWLVSSGELNEKPVMAISASPLPSGGDRALASLMHTLSALGTRMDEKSSLGIPAISKKINEAGRLDDSETIQKLQSLLRNLLKLIDTNEPEETRWNEKK